MSFCFIIHHTSYFFCEVSGISRFLALIIDLALQFLAAVVKMTVLDVLECDLVTEVGFVFAEVRLCTVFRVVIAQVVHLSAESFIRSLIIHFLLLLGRVADTSGVLLVLVLVGGIVSEQGDHLPSCTLLEDVSFNADLEKLFEDVIFLKFS